MPSGGSRPQHQERSFVWRIEWGFDFLGYHFRPGQLSVAGKTIERFVARAIRLYEQEPREADASARFGLYVRRWIAWAGAGLGRSCCPVTTQKNSYKANAGRDK